MPRTRSTFPLALLTIARLAASPRDAAAVDCTYTDVEAGLPSLVHSETAWGDYDMDGDLDFLLIGSPAPGVAIARLFRNSGGPNPTFSNAGAGLLGVAGGSVEWGDYDGDGDLDILLTGLNNNLARAKVYRNNGGANPTFTDVGAALAPVILGWASWGDYDNDGDLDVVLTGDTGTPVTKVYRNSGGASPTFTDIGAGLPGVTYSSVAWGDCDGDGGLDILLTGSMTTGTGPAIARIYRNSGGANPTFTDIGAGLTGVLSSFGAWGDYDNDGDLDALIAGNTDSFNTTTRVYRNSGGPNATFTDIGAGLSGSAEGSVAWGDHDNDGDLDIVFTGWDGAAASSKVYRNNGGANPTFTDIGAGLAGAERAFVSLADYDNDGDLDILLTGGEAGTRLYRNSACAPNTPPTTPTGLAATLDADGATFSWNAASDAQTPAAGLTYNLRVGTTPGGSEIFQGMAAASGYRQVVRHGNTGLRRQWTLKTPPVSFYWSVQAMDGAFAGSPFASQVTTGVPELPVAPAAVVLGIPRPNPFSTGTRIALDLTHSATVLVRAYDVSGRLVRTIADRPLSAGRHQLEWDGRDDRGERVVAGAYVWTVEAEGFRESRIVLRVR